MQESGTVQVLGMKRWMRHGPFPPSLYPHGRRSIKTLCYRADWRHEKEVVGSYLTGQNYRDWDLAKWGVFRGADLCRTLDTMGTAWANAWKLPTSAWHISARHLLFVDWKHETLLGIQANASGSEARAEQGWWGEMSEKESSGHVMHV